MNKSSVLNLSHNVSLSAKMGQILPICVFDVVPGDKINHKIYALLRTQPLLAPVMHTVDIDLHVFFSPDRLVWDEAEDFHTGGDLGTSAPEWPHMEAPVGGYLEGSLGDYLGLALSAATAGRDHSALPFRHYNLIYNQYYRDTQLQSEVTIDRTSGLDTTTPRNLLAPCWKRDYFTACRPAPQLGAEVSIPLTGDAPVTGIGTNNSTWVGVADQLNVRETEGAALTYPFSYQTNADTLLVRMDGNAATTHRPLVYADLTDVSAVDIRDLREASAVQRHLEFNNTFGGGYFDQIRARFHVPVQDYRLQIPEYLGSGSTKLQFSEVLQTAEGDDPVGEMRGHGISILGSNRYSRRIPEHGYIFVFLVIRPKTQYMQGLHRMWSRETKYDYLLPEFQRIGDQQVLNKEIYWQHTTPDGVFGYNPIYEEYRTIPSRVAGEFRSTLKYWHMAREFSGDPALNSTFVTANPTTRIFPDTESDNMYINVQHKIMARRRLAKHVSPRLL